MSTTVPITVAPEAAAFLDANGLRPAFEQILEHTCQAVPYLSALVVDFSPYHDVSAEEFVAFRAAIAAGADTAFTAEDEWMKWMIRHFPFAVTRRFVLFAHPEAAHAR
jgi:hypothetical protein